MPDRHTAPDGVLRSLPAFGQVTIRDRAELGSAGLGYFQTLPVEQLPRGRSFEFAADGFIRGVGHVF
jgi:hypothetical protein